MFDFVPIDKYVLYFYQFFLIVTLLVIVYSLSFKREDKNNIVFLNFIGYISLFFTIFYIGFRPISGVFLDMTTYAYTFERFQENNYIDFTEDYGFYYFMILCTKLMTKEIFFFVCATLYIVPLYIVSKKIFKKYWFYSFLMLCISLSFWAYGTNGIRNGIATSLFLLSFSFNKKKYLAVLLMLFSCTFHQTMLLPTFAYLITLFYNSTQKYLLAWLVAIPISLIWGNFFVKYIEMSGIGLEKVGTYFTEEVDEGFSQTGFRWDFLIYSSSAVFTGWYFIIKKKFKDKFYSQLFNVFLISNTFWILIIQVNFSNRFAYLSWFMMGLIIVYPFLRSNILKNQSVIFAKVVFLYFLFTFTMNVLLKLK